MLCMTLTIDANGEPAVVADRIGVLRKPLWDINITLLTCHHWVAYSVGHSASPGAVADISRVDIGQYAMPMRLEGYTELIVCP